MQPLNFLKPEIADKLHNATSDLFEKDPISKIVTLYNLFSNHDESKVFDEKTAKQIKAIMDNHPEQILLHFATYDPQNTSHAAFVTPISDNFDCVTYIRKNRTLESDAVASVLKRKDFDDFEFDLSMVSTHNLDDGEQFIKTYLFGDPYSEDYQYVAKTDFSSIDDVIENNK